MEIFRIGNTEVPVYVKSNKRLKSRRLSVSASGVLVEAPDALLGSINTLLESKASWIFTEWRKHKDAIKQSPWPEEFTTGAKILFLGRYTPIIVNESGRRAVVLELGNHFEVKCSSNIGIERKSEVIRGAFVKLFSEKTAEIARVIGKAHGFTNLNIIVNRRKDRWAACREDNTIVLGWDLVFLPKPVVEYVIVHELVHTQERNHSKDFWSALAVYMPDWRERGAALQDCERRFLLEMDA